MILDTFKQRLKRQSLFGAPRRQRITTTLIWKLFKFDNHKDSSAHGSLKKYTSTRPNTEECPSSPQTKRQRLLTEIESDHEDRRRGLVRTARWMSDVSSGVLQHDNTGKFEWRLRTAYAKLKTSLFQEEH
jgi:hypothetical protein